MKWICVLGICWFLITHGPVSFPGIFLNFFPSSVIFYDFFPQSMLNSLCHLGLGLEHLRIVSFFPQC